MAELYAQQGKYEKALELIDQTIEIQESAYGLQHHLMATAWLTKAAICQGLGDYDQAENLLHKSLAVIEKDCGDQHPLAGRILNQLGNLYLE